jgi:hypothetical protein
VGLSAHLTRESAPVGFRGPESGVGRRRAAVRYATLAGALFLANVVLLDALVLVVGSVVVAKVLTELSLFLTSFVVQRLVVFRRPSRSEPQPAGGLADRADAAASTW